MSETPKKEEVPAEEVESNEGSYYYDDATGYEKFDPEAEDEIEESSSE